MIPKRDINLTQSNWHGERERRKAVREHERLNDLCLRQVMECLGSLAFSEHHEWNRTGMALQGKAGYSSVSLTHLSRTAIIKLLFCPVLSCLAPVSSLPVLKRKDTARGNEDSTGLPSLLSPPPPTIIKGKTKMVNQNPLTCYSVGTFSRERHHIES